MYLTAGIHPLLMIKVLKASRDTYWYNRIIGKTILVTELESEGKEYIVCKTQSDEESIIMWCDGLIIEKADAQVIGAIPNDGFFWRDSCTELFKKSLDIIKKYEPEKLKQMVEDLKKNPI